MVAHHWVEALAEVQFRDRLAVDPREAGSMVRAAARPLQAGRRWLGLVVAPIPEEAEERQPGAHQRKNLRVSQGSLAVGWLEAVSLEGAQLTEPERAEPLALEPERAEPSALELVEVLPLALGLVEVLPLALGLVAAFQKEGQVLQAVVGRQGLARPSDPGWTESLLGVGGSCQVAASAVDLLGPKEPKRNLGLRESPVAVQSLVQVGGRVRVRGRAQVGGRVAVRGLAWAERDLPRGHQSGTHHRQGEWLRTLEWEGTNLAVGL